MLEKEHDKEAHLPRKEEAKHALQKTVLEEIDYNKNGRASNQRTLFQL